MCLCEYIPVGAFEHSCVYRRVCVRAALYVCVIPCEMVCIYMFASVLVCMRAYLSAYNCAVTTA